jgi:4-amino-4-deoxy-L-arabinose transferase-like glycosyltransferase
MSRRAESIVLLAILVAFAAATAAVIAKGAPFEYDEAVYASKARALSGGAAASAWSPHRAPALPVIGAAIVRLGGRAEWPFRAIGLLSGIALLLAAWACARRLFGALAGVLAAGVLAGAYTIVGRSAQFLTDVPAAAALLAATIFILRPEKRAPAIAALFLLLAFYLRYGSAVPVAALAVFAACRRRDRAALAGLGVLVAGLVPHAIVATRDFGAPWGVLAYTSRVAGRAYAGQGLLAYARWFPYRLAGPVAAVAMAAGIAFGIARRHPLLAVALAHVVAIGLADHGEPRFVFFPVALLAILGAGCAASFAARRSEQRLEARAGAPPDSTARPRAVAARAAALTVLVASIAIGGVAAARTTERSARGREAAKAAGLALARDARASGAGRPCAATASQAAVVGWYSGCEVTPPRR